MGSKKKLLTTVAALTTAAALLLGGTFAWQSISQSALNESTDTVNPGGRLHNDIAAENAMNTLNYIYVENFSGDADEDGNITGGEDIYARIRLEEYMELVMNYRVDGMEVVKKVAGKKTPITDSTYSADDATRKEEFNYIYELHFFGDDADNATDDYWTWKLGEEDHAANYGGYMPTFNKNKDSLAADQNGSYTEAIGGIIERGQNYNMDADDVMGFQTYRADKGETTKRTAWAIYDNDGNDADELSGLSAADLNDIIKNGDSSTSWSADYANAVHLESEEHTAKQLPTTKGVISMADWLAMAKAWGPHETEDGSPKTLEEIFYDDLGHYWVYDEDGWVYWSSPIKPGDATGPLLEGFGLNHEMDDTWYYAINVEAQFITADDLGRTNGTGFYDKDGWYDPEGLDNAEDYRGKGQAPTDNALKLLKYIGVQDTDAEIGVTRDLELTGGMSAIATIGREDDVRLTNVREEDAEILKVSVLSTSGLQSGISLTKDTDYTYDPTTQMLSITNSAYRSPGTAIRVELSGTNSAGQTVMNGLTGLIVVDPDNDVALREKVDTDEGRRIADVAIVKLNQEFSYSLLDAGDAAAGASLSISRYSSFSSPAFTLYDFSNPDDNALFKLDKTAQTLTLKTEDCVGSIVQLSANVDGKYYYGYLLVRAGDSTADDADEEDNTIVISTFNNETGGLDAIPVCTGRSIKLDKESITAVTEVSYKGAYSEELGDNETVTLTSGTDYTYDASSHILVINKTDATDAATTTITVTTDAGKCLLYLTSETALSIAETELTYTAENTADTVTSGSSITLTLGGSSGSSAFTPQATFQDKDGNAVTADYSVEYSSMEFGDDYDAPTEDNGSYYYAGSDETASEENYIVKLGADGTITVDCTKLTEQLEVSMRVNVIVDDWTVKEKSLDMMIVPASGT